MTLDVVFLACVVLIWTLIISQLVLTTAGYLYALRARREHREVAVLELDWPTVSVLVPARNEERVIRSTIEGLARQDYPRDRLEIIIVDDASTDRTRDIVRACQRDVPNVRLLETPRGEGGRGKSRALNRGVRAARGQMIAIYDADGIADPSAIRLLVAQLVRDPGLGAALGLIRTNNRTRTVLTRLIALETVAFQWITQAGKWALGHLATLPGTNYVIRRKILEELGGWDEEALAEDAELSIRVYELGYAIKFVPYAIAHEQKPETIGVWLRQRRRWVRGHNYVLGKYLPRLSRLRSRRISVELLHVFLLHYVFFVGVVASNVLFLLSVAGLASSAVPPVFALVWPLALIVFVLKLSLVGALEDENGLEVVGLALLMYFTYCQAWLYVVASGLVHDAFLRKPRVWDKTERFEVRTETTKAA